MNLISIHDLSDDDLLHLSEGPAVSSAALRSSPPAGLRGTIAFLFQQPSLRTMSSFAAAAARLGLVPISISTAGNDFRDQIDFEDEIQQLSLTSQCVVVRSNGALNPADHCLSPVPIVNAGDGNNEHPTQTLIDLAVMRQFGIARRTIVIMGNLRDHRTTHSLALALQRFDVTVRLVSPRELAMDPSYTSRSMEVVHAESERERDDAVADADFVYLLPTMSLHSPPKLFEDLYRFDRRLAERVLKPSAKLLHPFPRFGELNKDLDYSKFDAYHLQTSLGPHVREKVLTRLMSLGEERLPDVGTRLPQRDRSVHQRVAELSR